MNESQETKKKDEIGESDSSGDNDSLYSQESTYQLKNDPDRHTALTELNDSDQLRYESFRRSNLPKGLVKKFINLTIGQAVNPNIVIGVAGLCKVFVGEMVTEAKKVQKERRTSGPLLPSHIHEAFRRLSKRSPSMKVFRKEPWNR